GREPHRPGRNEPGGAGAEATQAGEEDPQTSRSEGDPGDKGQDSEALFRLRGGAQGCRRWRRGGARSVDTHAGTGGTCVVGAVHGAFIYVADYFSHVVWRLDTATGEEVVVAGTGGGTSFGGDGGPATAAQLGFPLGVAVDAAGNLAIADQSNDRIRLVNATTGVITTGAGKESSGFSGDG